MKPEILAPAGDFEKLRSAVYFGADAVYLAGKSFGMRAASGNFTDGELAEAVDYAHKRGVKVYVTANIMPRDEEYPALRRFLVYLREIGADAVILSDIGAVSLAGECVPELDIHISTQASTVSAAACTAWYRLGAKRVVTARELSLEALANIRRILPPELELESFVHGSMCVAYSGRCLLSQYYVGRDANRGECAQPCRWIYGAREPKSLGIAEQKRAGEVLPVYEDGGESFVMSSRDMCMIEHIPELCAAGINSFKLEGRVRSAYYTAVVTNTYKMALDAYMSDPAGYRFDERLRRELDCVSHREYDTGFFFDSPRDNACVVSEPGYIREKAYLATVLTESDETGLVTLVQRNKLTRSMTVELLTPGRTGISFGGFELFGEGGEELDCVPHPQMVFKMRAPVQMHAGDILREG